MLSPQPGPRSLTSLHRYSLANEVPHQPVCRQPTHPHPVNRVTIGGGNDHLLQLQLSTTSATTTATATAPRSPRPNPRNPSGGAWLGEADAERRPQQQHVEQGPRESWAALLYSYVSRRAPPSSLRHGHLVSSGEPRGGHESCPAGRPRILAAVSAPRESFPGKPRGGPRVVPRAGRGVVVVYNTVIQ